MKRPTLNLSDEEKRLLWQLRIRGPAPRSTLAAALQVSNAAITKLSQQLLKLDLIDELETPTPTRRGRPTVPLGISSAGGYAVGATAHKGVVELALIDYAGKVIALTSENMEAPTPHDFAQWLDRRIHELAVEHRLIGARPLGVGIAVPGPALSSDGNRWNVINALPGWRDVPLRQIMDSTLNLPVWIENDATAAALAEYYLGELLPYHSTIVVLLLGYGIGAGIVDRGHPFKGEFGNAGEIGCLYPVHRPRPSTLDLFATLRENGCNISSISEFEEKTRGYEGVIETWQDRSARQLQHTVNSAIAWLDPGAITLSSHLPTFVMDGLAKRLNRAKLAWGGHREGFPIGISKLGGAATTLGAALLPIHASTART